MRSSLQKQQSNGINQDKFQAKNPYIIALSSAIASVTTQIICSPFGVVGVRQQKAYRTQLFEKNNQNITPQAGNSYVDQHSFINSFKKIYKHEGYKTFFNGIRYALISTIISSVTMFMCYEQSMQYLNQYLNTAQASIVSSLSVSAVSTTVSFPFEYWKTLSQASHGKCEAHNFQLGKRIYSAYFLTLQRNILLFSSWFPVLEIMRENYKKYISDQHTYKHIICNNVTSGFVAGTVSGLITQPFDICKNRKQIFQDFEQINGTFKTIYQLFKQEGLQSFTVGIKTRVFGVSLYGSILFSIYEVGGKFMHNSTRFSKNLQQSIEDVEEAHLHID